MASAETSKSRPRSKGLVAALVVGLSYRVLELHGEHLLETLSPERRILLLLVAVRLLIMLWANLNAPEPAQATSKPKAVAWHEVAQASFFVLPLFAVFYAVWRVTDGHLLYSAELALGSGFLFVVLIGAWLVIVARRLRGIRLDGITANADETSQKQGGLKFWVDCLFYALTGLISALVIVAIPVVSPGFAEDVMAIGRVAVNLYIILFAVQLLLGLSADSRRAEKTVLPPPDSAQDESSAESPAIT